MQKEPFFRKRKNSIITAIRSRASIQITTPVDKETNSDTRTLSTSSNSFITGLPKMEIERLELLPFSALRCLLNPEEACDPSKCRGYFQAAFSFDSLRFESQMCLLNSPQIKNLSGGKNSASGKPLLNSGNLAAALEYLLPAMCAVITVGKCAVFRSSAVSLTRDMLDIIESDKFNSTSKPLGGIPSHHTCKKERSDQYLNPVQQLNSPRTPEVGSPIKLQDEQDQWIVINKLLSGTSINSVKDPRMSIFNPKFGQFGKKNWTASFDIYHPHSIVGIHLVSVDSTTSFATDEILASKFIQATNLHGMSKKPIQLQFAFRYPLSYSVDNESSMISRSRECKVTLGFRVSSQFSSIFGSLPAFGMDEPEVEVFRSGPNSNVRLLSVEFAPSNSMPFKSIPELSESRELFPSWEDSREDIQTTIKHAHLFIDIMYFWLMHLHRITFQILSWQRPILSILVATYIGAVVIPYLTYPLVLLIVPFMLLLTRKLEDPILPRIIEIYSAERPSAAKFKTTFQAESETKTEEKTPVATEVLVKTLIQSALPNEVADLTKHLRVFLASWLPLAVLFHCLLAWNPSPMFHSFKTACHLKGCEDTSDVEKKFGWQDTSSFQRMTYSKSKLREFIPVESDSLLLVLICTITSALCFFYTRRFLDAMVIINTVWYSHMLVARTRFVIAFKRAIRALFLGFCCKY